MNKIYLGGCTIHTFLQLLLINVELPPILCPCFSFTTYAICAEYPNHNIFNLRDAIVLLRQVPL